MVSCTSNSPELFFSFFQAHCVGSSHYAVLSRAEAKRPLTAWLWLLYWFWLEKEKLFVLNIFTS
jgi:hypothetical protein